MVGENSHQGGRVRRTRVMGNPEDQQKVRLVVTGIGLKVGRVQVFTWTRHFNV